uniref:Uncharacterized protein n=1 Tax=Salix viminalis TaxID=40686 RepID=A0A6N2MBP4_SALVM
MIRRRFLGGGVTTRIGVLDGVTENMGNSRGVKREVRTTWVQGFEILVISGGTLEFLFTFSVDIEIDDCD